MGPRTPAADPVLLWLCSLGWAAGQAAGQGLLAQPRTEPRWWLGGSSSRAGPSPGTCSSREGTGLVPREEQDAQTQARGEGRRWGCGNITAVAAQSLLS